MSTNVLLIDDSGGPNILDTIRCLSYEQSVNIFVVSPERKAYFNTIPYCRYVSKYHYLKTTEPKDQIQEINSLEQKWNIGIILPVKHSNYKFITEYKDLFNGSVFPPIPSKKAFNTVTNKLLLSEYLEKNSFPFPQSRILSETNIDQFTFPLLLKPKFDSNGIRIIECKSKQEYEQYINRKDFKIDDYIIQEKLLGEDIDISFLAKDGEIIAYTIQKGLTRESYSFATAIEFVKNQQLLDQTKALVKKLNWSGIAHLDFIYQKESDSYILVDFNPRMWSTLIGSTHAGVNFPIAMLKAGLKKEYKFSGYSNIQFFLAKQAIALHKKELIKGRLSSLRNSPWKDIIKDPLPELLKGISNIL